VRTAIAAAGVAADAKGVQIEARIDAGVGQVTGDPARLHQAIWNVLANAVKFTAAGGRVGVRLERRDSDAVVTVNDTGTGMTPEVLAHVFDGFRQGESGATRSFGGLGIGLTIVRELVQLHGGDIEAGSAGPGRGSQFTIRLPLRTEEPRATPSALPPSVPPASAWPALDGVRAVVVEAEPDVREMLSLVLAQRGADVRAVGSTGEALELLERWRPDVLITDESDERYALVGKVRTLEADRGGRIPAVALTSYARSDDRLRSLLGGARRDLPKPVEPFVLAAEVARLTGRERRRRAR
jgi:CheY-like chemotaxis protein